MAPHSKCGSRQRVAGSVPPSPPLIQTAEDPAGPTPRRGRAIQLPSSSETRRGRRRCHRDRTRSCRSRGRGRRRARCRPAPCRVPVADRCERPAADLGEHDVQIDRPGCAVGRDVLRVPAGSGPGPARTRAAVEAGRRPIVLDGHLGGLAEPDLHRQAAAVAPDPAVGPGPPPDAQSTVAQLPEAAEDRLGHDGPGERRLRADEATRKNAARVRCRARSCMPRTSASRRTSATCGPAWPAPRRSPSRPVTGSREGDTKTRRARWPRRGRSSDGEPDQYTETP